MTRKQFRISWLKLVILFLCGFKNSFGQIRASQQNNKWGFTDNDQNVVVPFEFDQLPSVLAPVMVAKRDGFFGLIDQNGNALTDFVYFNVRPSKNMTDQQEDFYEIMVDSSSVKNRKILYGLADKSGKIILPPIYENTKAIDSKTVAGRPWNSSHYQFFDTSGKLKFTLKGRIIQQGFDNQSFRVDDVLYNLDGSQVFSQYYPDLYWTDRTYIIYGKYQQRRLCRVDGKELLPASYKDIKQGQPGQFIVQQDDQQRMIVDTTGSIVVPMSKSFYKTWGSFYIASDFGIKEEPTGLMDIEGNILIPKLYYFQKLYANVRKDEAQISFPENYFRLQHFETKKMGIVRIDGKILVPAIYHMTHYRTDHHPLMVQNDSLLFGVVDTTGKVLIDIKYPYLHWTTDPDLFWALDLLSLKYGIVQCNKRPQKLPYESIEHLLNGFTIARKKEGCHVYLPNGKLTSPALYDDILGNPEPATTDIIKSQPGFYGSIEVVAVKNKASYQIITGINQDGRLFSYRLLKPDSSKTKKGRKPVIVEWSEPSLLEVHKRRIQESRKQ